MFFIAIKNGHILGLCPPLGPLCHEDNFDINRDQRFQKYNLEAKTLRTD